MRGFIEAAVAGGGGGRGFTRPGPRVPSGVGDGNIDPHGLAQDRYAKGAQRRLTYANYATKFATKLA